MSCYLFHLEPRYHYARHYLGWSDDIDRRVKEHLSGGAKASPLVVAARSAGCAVVISRRWDGREYDRAFERKLKNSKHLSRVCPLCQTQQTPNK